LTTLLVCRLDGGSVERLMSEETGRNVKGSVPGLFETLLRLQGTSVRTADISGETQTEHLKKTSLTCHRYTTLICVTALNFPKIVHLSQWFQHVAHAPCMAYREHIVAYRPAVMQ
jgi:hypothetical protein